MASDAGPAPLRQHSCKKLHRKQSYGRRGKSSSCTVLLHFLRYVLLLLPPALYLSGVITCVGPILQWGPPPPGSVYRTHLLFDQLWPRILADHSPAIQLGSMWRLKRKQHKHTVTCPNITTSVHKTTDIPGEAAATMYLMVDANGGLNQQRSSICSAVAVAGLLGATLVIPRFEFHNLWRDSSQFADIYDEDYFISALKDLVTVVRELPEELMKAYDYNISNVPTFRVEAWAPHTFYLNEVYPVLRDQRVIRISPFANRLSMDVPPDIQFLRCHANYKALRFSSSISTLAQKLVNRMTEKSSTSSGRYVSVHLRFEEDMVAFSCCLYDGGWSEKYYLDTIRTKGWGQKFKKRDRIDAPGLNRMNGKCPMTPLEVGLMLRGMGLANDTPIYLASGKIYQAEKSLEPLRKMFPLLETKETLATTDELAVFQGFSSRLAALDYSVCLYSEVFVSTQGGNFPHFLMGHRRFLYNGHAKTIKPDKRSLVLLLHNSSVSWDAFKNEMQSMLAASVRTGGSASRTKRKSKRKDSVYLNPLPDCQCLWEPKNFSSGLAL